MRLSIIYYLEGVIKNYRQHAVTFTGADDADTKIITILVSV